MTQGEWDGALPMACSAESRSGSVRGGVDSGRLRIMSAEDIPKACEMFHEVYGHPIEVLQWRWKYHEGPRLAGINWVWEAADGSLQGHIGASVFPGVYAGQSIAMAQVGDIMIKKAARGSMGRSGVYRQLVGAMQKSLQAYHPSLYAYGFPGERPFRLGEKIGFYKRLYACTDYKIEPKPISTWRRFWLRLSEVSDIRQNAVLGQSVCQSLDNIWADHYKTSAPAGVGETPRLVKDGQYVAWRYFGRSDPDAPHYRLQILTAWGRPCGWLVTRELSGGLCVVDGSWPNQAAFEFSVDTLAWSTQRPVTAWAATKRATAQTSPIVAGELEIAGQYTGWPAVAVMPGDTDVY